MTDNNQTNIDRGRIVVIASSTGGPAALAKILPGLPEDLPVPVVIIQHILPGFAEGLSDFLQEKCSMQVRTAQKGESVKPGVIYVAPSEYHLKLNALHRFEYGTAEPIKGIRPSADYFLKSLKDTGYGEIVVVVLTGMGSDGAEGIQELSKKKKLKVLVQDEESSVVYGMPGNVVKACPESLVVPLEKMAGEVVRMAGVN